MSVAVTGGLFPRGEGRSFSARRAGHEKSKQSHSRLMGNVIPGRGGLHRMKLLQSTMTAGSSCQELEPADSKIAVIQCTS